MLKLQSRLRADLRRQFQNLVALGWLGRAYQLLPCLVSAVLPKVFEFEAYNASAPVLQEELELGKNDMQPLLACTKSFNDYVWLLISSLT